MTTFRHFVLAVLAVTTGSTVASLVESMRISHVAGGIDGCWKCADKTKQFSQCGYDATNDKCNPAVCSVTTISYYTCEETPASGKDSCETHVEKEAAYQSRSFFKATGLTCGAKDPTKLPGMPTKAKCTPYEEFTFRCLMNNKCSGTAWANPDDKTLTGLTKCGKATN